jgi:hypothetical protein
VSQLHRPKAGGPSPGRIVCCFIAHLPSLRLMGYGKNIELRWSRAPRSPWTPAKGSLTLRWQSWTPASFRSLIGYPSAVTPLWGSNRGFLRAPLPSPTCSLLPRALAGFSPASRLPCRSHLNSNATGVRISFRDTAQARQHDFSEHLHMLDIGAVLQGSWYMSRKRLAFWSAATTQALRLERRLTSVLSSRVSTVLKWGKPL